MTPQFANPEPIAAEPVPPAEPISTPEPEPAPDPAAESDPILATAIDLDVVEVEETTALPPASNVAASQPVAEGAELPPAAQVAELEPATEAHLIEQPSVVEPIQTADPLTPPIEESISPDTFPAESTETLPAEVLLPADDLNPVKGTGLSPYIPEAESERALAPEVCFLETWPANPPQSEADSTPSDLPPADEPSAAAEPISISDSAPAIDPAPTPAAAARPAPPPSAPKPLIKLQSRDDNADLSPFSVVVDQVYDGPLDLLLDLIRKQDIDIYDIPIALITAQFLAYVNQLRAGDVDVAGEFIYIASLLIHIKSKMLLPRAPSGPEDAVEDPRRELVERLLEHERFKNAAQMLQQKQMLEAATWTNPGLREFQDDAAAEPELAADTVDLVRIFRDILERARNRPVIDVSEDSVTVGQMIQFLARRLTMEDKPIALRRLLSHTRSERALIAMFLALLELVRLQAVLLRQDRAFSEIFIKKHTGFDAAMNEGLANARDDWR